MTEAANADQIAYWNAGAGETWAALQERMDKQLEPLGLRAMQALAPRAGERILDIGCGSGQTTLALGACPSIRNPISRTQDSCVMWVITAVRREQGGCFGRMAQ